ncbi:hypothetical protein LPTSP4_13470 [Leptospira ryugenii]|uniref:DNA 3'-5' helicase n=1 Tax=Leptospira ryugenii TaxID=1917863 RepID=A0A2P2DYX4_9LEPT|nr:ATP-dependent helicase [Leptospira ryugenii]GBF49828.1 hypothetical protein LPTSP4_13470 [Leptospira ryugenii]
MWSDEQQRIIESKEPIKQIIAAAGSGKTATLMGILTHLEKDPSFLPEKTLLITFTNKATEELSHRIAGLGLSSCYHISTFHAFCYRNLNLYHPLFKRHSIVILAEEEKIKFTLEFLTNYKFQVGGIPFALLFQRNAYLLRTEFPEIFFTYQSELRTWKTKSYRYEFDDLPQFIFEGLQNKEDWTTEIKNRYNYIFVDEFQDTDFSQLHILKMMQPRNITVVGDDWQAIYGFRGASVEPFLEFPKFFPGAVQFLLSTNYRSLSGIVNLSTHAIRKNKDKIDKQVFAHRKGCALFERIEFPQETTKVTQGILERVQTYFTQDTDSILLVRSNYRKHEWKRAGLRDEQVSTIHAAKGLEYSTVLLDLSTGWTISQSQIKESLEEERRILYVGLSRSKNRIVLIGRKPVQNRVSLEDLFYSDFRGFNDSGKLTLLRNPLW